MDVDRPVLSSVDVELGERVQVTVTLQAAGREHVGRSEGSADEAVRARVVGEATLEALRSVTGSGHEFDLSAVGASTLEGVTMALVQVRERETSDLYVGSALIRQGDAVLATARAVLDALNRRLALIT